MLLKRKYFIFLRVLYWMTLAAGYVTNLNYIRTPIILNNFEINLPNVYFRGFLSEYFLCAQRVLIFIYADYLRTCITK